MARPRKPTAHLELVGAFQKNPNRARDSEPVSEDPIGEAPDRLSDLQAEAWDYLVDCCAAGVLTKMDRAYLELCAIELAFVWSYNAALQDPESKLPHRGSGSLTKDIASMLGKLGMNPSERSKVIVARKPKTNPFTAFRKA